MPPRHCWLFAETKFEKSKEKEEWQRRQRWETTFQRDREKSDRDDGERRMASAKSHPEITRPPMEAIDSMAIYRASAPRKTTVRSSVRSSLSLFFTNREECSVRGESKLKEVAFIIRPPSAEKSAFARCLANPSICTVHLFRLDLSALLNELLALRH